MPACVQQLLCLIGLDVIYLLLVLLSNTCFLFIFPHLSRKRERRLLPSSLTFEIVSSMGDVLMWKM